MALTMILTGDVNLMHVADPLAPFALVRDATAPSFSFRKKTFAKPQKHWALPETC